MYSVFMPDKIAIVVTYIQQSLWYATFLLLLAILSAGIFMIEILALAPQHVSVLIQLDLLIAYIFLIDFFLGWRFNSSYTSSRAYWRDNWLNFISSIPISTEITSALRVLRAVRAIRVIRLVRAGVGLTLSEKRRRQNGQR